MRTKMRIRFVDLHKIVKLFMKGIAQEYKMLHKADASLSKDRFLKEYHESGNLIEYFRRDYLIQKMRQLANLGLRKTPAIMRKYRRIILNRRQCNHTILVSMIRFEMAKFVNGNNLYYCYCSGKQEILNLRLCANQIYDKDDISIRCLANDLEEHIDRISSFDDIEEFYYLNESGENDFHKTLYHNA